MTMLWVSILLLSMGIAFSVFVFFYTDALYHYGTLPGIWKFFLPLRLQDYMEWKNKSENEKFYYPVFYREKFNPGFWTTLIGCPLCLCGFLSESLAIGLALLKGSILYVFLGPVIGFLSLLFYFILTKLKPE